MAGGIPYGLTPTESLIKECMEEASLPEDIASKAKPAGCVSYFYRHVISYSSKASWNDEWNQDRQRMVTARGPVCLRSLRPVARRECGRP